MHLQNSSQGKDAVFRVPVCSPAFLQMKPPHTVASRQIIHSNNLFPVSYCPPRFRESRGHKNSFTVCHKNFNLAHIFWSINDSA